MTTRTIVYSRSSISSSSALRNAIEGDEQDLEAVKLKILTLLDSVTQSGDTDSAQDSDSADEEPEILNESEAGEDEIEDLEYTNVREAVKYFDKLL